MRAKNNSMAVAVAAALSLSGVTSGTVAQERATVIEELIVTALKREETLQEAPISISAFSSGMIEDFGVFEANDVAAFTPNVAALKTPGSSSNIVYGIRGIANTEPLLTMDHPVGIYMDGVYIGRSTGAAFDLVDLERIEVLRGPQGTLFGRNTTAGAINVITTRPLGELAFKQQLSMGNRDYWRSHTRIDLPEVAGFSTQISYLKNSKGGLVGNLANTSHDELGEEETEAWRVAVNWQVSDNLMVDWSFDRTEKDQVAIPFQVTAVDQGMLAVDNNPAFAGLPGFYATNFFNSILAEADTERRGNLNLANIKPRSVDLWGHALTVTYDLEDTTLKSITAYREIDDLARGQDLDGGSYGYPVFEAQLDNSQHQFSQEFQVIGSALDESVDYVAGVYYFQEKAREDNPQQVGMPGWAYLGVASGIDAALSGGGFVLQGLCAAATGDANCIGVAGIGNPQFTYNTENTSLALFGQANYILPILEERLEVTVGLRYTEDERKADVTNTALQAFGPAFGTAALLEAEEEWSKINYTLVADYSWSDNTSTYLKYSTGYKSGGFNTRSVDPQDPSKFTTPFDPEEIESAELGIKSEWFDHRLRFNGAIFHNTYDDLQVQQFEAGFAGATSVTVNAGSATIQGYEFDLVAVPIEGLTVTLGYGYTDAEYDEFMYQTQLSPAPVDLADQAKFVVAPEHTANLSVQYEFEPFSFGQFTARVDSSYQDEVYFHPLSAFENGMSEMIKADDRTLVNARVTLAEIPVAGDGELRVALWGKNLENKEYRVWGIDFGGLGYGGNTYGELRSYGFDIVYEM